MALTAKLQFGDNSTQQYEDKIYLVTDYKWRIICPHNEVRPDGMARCEHMELTVVSPGKEDQGLLKWYVNQDSMSGRILVEMSNIAKNTNSTWKQVLFNSALCYSIEEKYNINECSRRELRLKLAVESLTVDDVSFTAEL